MGSLGREILLAAGWLAVTVAGASAQSSDVKVGIETPSDQLRGGDYVRVRAEFPAGAFVSGFIDPVGIAEDGFKRRLWDESYMCSAGRTCLGGSVYLASRLAPGSHELPVTLVDAAGRERVFALRVRSDRALDTDGDGMPDVWEQRNGLDARSSSGDNGADGDPDGDGDNNLQEYRLDTFPRGRYRQYFAEASSGERQQSWSCIDVFQPDLKPAVARVRFIGDEGRTKSELSGLYPRSQLCALPYFDYLADRVVEVVVESDEPIVAERVIMRGSSTRARASASMTEPSLEWHFADGVGAGDYDAFLLTFNPQSQPVEAEFVYYRTAGEEPIRRTRVLPPGARTTVWVNQDDPEASGRDLALTIRAAAPILVERGWRRDPPGRTVPHEFSSPGTATSSATWLFPHMAIGTPASVDWTTTFAIANPGDQPAVLEATLYGGANPPTAMRFEVGARSREVLSLDALHRLRPVTGVVSMEVRSVDGVPVVIERTLESRRPAGEWRQSAVGVTQTAERWALADAWPFTASELAIVNTSDIDARVQVKSAEETDHNGIATQTITVDVPAKRMRVVALHSTPDEDDGSFLRNPRSLAITSLPDADGRVALIAVERVAQPTIEGSGASVATVMATRRAEPRNN